MLILQRDMVTSTLLVATLLAAGTPDTLRTATVVADRGVVVSRTDSLSVKQSQTVTELLLHIPSVSIGDNGGYAGLKTVSLRGLGSAHTTIYVDGVRVGNVQSGQGDLGALGLANFSSAVIDYAQNSLSFTSARPSFAYGRKVSGRASFAAGSFGTYLPAARLDWKVSDRLAICANAEALCSEGNYRYGDGVARENNDIKEFRGGLDFFGAMNEGDWHAKLWYNGAERGTPGSTSWPSTDRQKDRNVYVQGILRKQFSPLYSLQASTKAAYDDIYYTSSWGDSNYGQTEFQLNSSHKFNFSRLFSVSAAADVYWDGLKSNVYSQQRLGTTGTVTVALKTGILKAEASVQYDGIFDSGNAARNCFSPSLGLRIKAFEGFDIVSFARRAYRVPTFNELYYIGYGNPDLKAEDAWLADLGIDWKKKCGNWTLKAKVDGYWNLLQDKIMSAPSAADPNIWMPYNIGKVRSAGTDVTAGSDFSGNAWLLSFSASYGFQDAVDRTPDSDTYGEQIAYAARHSLSLNASATFRGWRADAVWNLRAGRRDSYGELPDWNTLDLVLGKEFDLGRAGIPSLTLSMKNITDCRYEMVSGYPMPGFSITGGIGYKF